MTGCATPGDRIWYSTSNSTKRKYPQSWELTETQTGYWIVVNTLRANQLVAEALAEQRILELTDYKLIKKEVRYGQAGSRLDFKLSAPHRRDCYVEVKSVTLLEGCRGLFPDTVTERGQKHLRDLISIAEQGDRAVLCFAVLHSGIKFVSPANHLDPEYGRLFAKALQHGVEVIAYQAVLTVNEIYLKCSIPVVPV